MSLKCGEMLWERYYVHVNCSFQPMCLHCWKNERHNVLSTNKPCPFTKRLKWDVFPLKLTRLILKLSQQTFLVIQFSPSFCFFFRINTHSANLTCISFFLHKHTQWPKGVLSAIIPLVSVCHENKIPPWGTASWVMTSPTHWGGDSI